jgi:hypothetical protein
LDLQIVVYPRGYQFSEMTDLAPVYEQGTAIHGTMITKLRTGLRLDPMSGAESMFKLGFVILISDENFWKLFGKFPKA